RRLRVNVSIPTDSERTWRAFEPKAPPLERRWQAAAGLKAAGIPVGIWVAPMLPLDNPAPVRDRLRAFPPAVPGVQDFPHRGGGFGADTGAEARRLLANVSWTAADYQAMVEHLRRSGEVFEGEAGFFPPG